MEEGVLDPEVVLRACLVYMSEDQVVDMATGEGFLDEDEIEDEDTQEEIDFSSTDDVDEDEEEMPL